MSEEEHFCQDDGSGKCMRCGRPMPVPKMDKEESDHYHQDDGSGKCVVCEKPM